MTLIFFIFILGVTVFIHELGHFLSAKACGVHVYEFSLGLGPQIFHFKRKNDETTYSIRLFPIGGYVSMAGEAEEEKGEIPKDKQLVGKPWRWRFLTIIAGILMNFLLALTLFFIVGLFHGGIEKTAYISEIEEGSQASLTNLQSGDAILSINGKHLYSSDLLLLELEVNKGHEITLGVRHENGKRENIVMTPEKVETDGVVNYHYGFAIESHVKKGFFPALRYAFEKSISLLLQLFTIIWYLLTGKLGLKAFSGPIGIYTLVGETRKAGLINLVYLTGYLSLNVGFMNFLPIPAMDGGRLFFLLIEKIKGSPVNQRFENAVHTVGLGLLMLLMVYITFQDIIRLL